MKRFILSAVCFVGLLFSNPILSMPVGGADEAPPTDAGKPSERASTASRAPRDAVAPASPQTQAASAAAPAGPPTAPQGGELTVGQTGMQLAAALLQVAPPTYAFMGACARACSDYVRTVVAPAVSVGLSRAARFAATSIVSTGSGTFGFVRGGAPTGDPTESLDAWQVVAEVRIDPKTGLVAALAAKTPPRKSLEGSDLDLPLPGPAPRRDDEDDSSGGAASALPL